MAMRTGIFELLIAVVFSGSTVSVPLGMPPLPEDPVLAKVAPEKCLYYSAWSGMATPDPNSGNHTERMLAEPELRELVAELERQLRLAAGAVARGESNPAGQLAEFAPDLVKTLLTRPTCAFLTRLEPSPTGVTVEGGLVVNLGDQAEAFHTQLNNVIRQMILPAEITIDGQPFRQLRLGDSVPTITWGLKSRYLVLGIGEGAVEAMLQRATTEAPAWYRQFRQRLEVPRLASCSYVDLKAVVAQAKQLGGPRVALLVEQLGLDGIQDLAAVTGLDKRGVVSRTLLRTDRKDGLLQLLDGPGLQPEELRGVPADAPLAIALKLDPTAVWKLALNLAQSIDPDEADDMRRGLAEMENALGIALQTDLLETLNGTWQVYVDPSNGGFLTGWTAVAGVRDARRLQSTHDRLLELFRREVGSRERVAVKESTFQDRKIYQLIVADDDFMVAPSWCLDQDELIVGLFPQAVRARLATRAAGESTTATASAGTAQTELAARLKPVFEQGSVRSLTYLDTRQILRLAYPALQLVLRAAAVEMDRDGFPIDVGMLPSQAVFDRHLQPSVSAVLSVQDGIEWRSSHTLPSTDLTTVAPALSAVLLPAVTSARFAARKAQGLNNLRQIGLAMHNFHDTYNALPAAYSADDNGKPLLSWRVHLLPFLEQSPLYSRFHLDEPWDSEHNKALISQMPDVFRSPHSTLLPGKTNYLALVNDKTAIAKPTRKGDSSRRGLRFADITDGLSNTALVVEVEDAKAVPWTKPEDLTPAGNGHPLGQIRGFDESGVPTLMGDGAVRVISRLLDVDTWKALLTRNGGEAVGEF